ncbi:hypothetical protein [Hoylesella buccalis]|uniref:hypothetical protein n=1 Tax=Hoylesella buccalis TaxID=28127 RepID=UPI000AF70A10|nr:hypothetical protein [Hoylesella buccalis]
MAVQISKNKNPMSEGGKKTPNYLGFLSLFSVFRGWPKYYSRRTLTRMLGL